MRTDNKTKEDNNMNNKVKLSKGTEVRPPVNGSEIQGFQGNGSFYSELPAEKQKSGLRINAAIPPKTFNGLVIGFVGLSAAGLVTAIVLILRALL